MTFDAVAAVLVGPLAAAAVLALLPGYRLSARLNVVAALLTFLAALSLFFGRPPAGPYLLVDDLNNVFIVLTTFVGFTTSVFSATYIGHELDIGRLTPRFLRFYHAMYQPPSVDDDRATLAHEIVVPAPHRRLDGFAHRGHMLEVVMVFRRLLGTGTPKRSYRRWRG